MSLVATETGDRSPVARQFSVPAGSRVTDQRMAMVIVAVQSDLRRGLVINRGKAEPPGQGYGLFPHLDAALAQNMAGPAQVVDFRAQQPGLVRAMRVMAIGALTLVVRTMPDGFSGFLVATGTDLSLRRAQQPRYTAGVGAVAHGTGVGRLKDGMLALRGLDLLLHVLMACVAERTLSAFVDIYLPLTRRLVTGITLIVREGLVDKIVNKLGPV